MDNFDEDDMLIYKICHNILFESILTQGCPCQVLNKNELNFTYDCDDKLFDYEECTECLKEALATEFIFQQEMDEGVRH